MASLSNINGIFDVHSTGAILFSTSHGTSGQILRSNGNAAPTWVAASTVIGGPYLPLTGGTLSGATATATGISFTVGGALTGTSAVFTDNVSIGVYASADTGSLLLNGSTANRQSVLKCTNGNLHIDADSTYITYINYYTGSGGITFGNGAGAASGASVSSTGVVYATGGNSGIWNTHTSNTGTVTSVATGNGLTGGTITSTGTLSLDRPNSQLGAVLAAYGTTAGSAGRIRCTAPFNTNTGKMFSIEVTLYTSYTQYNYVVSAYMYSTINQWYSPKAIYTTTGTATPDIYVGRDASGKAYISIANGSYTGVLVHNMTRGYQTSLADTYDPWTITVNSGNENSVGVSTSQVWTTANHTPGNYLPLAGGTMTNTNLVTNMNADLLDGQQGSYYFQTNITGTAAGNVVAYGTSAGNIDSDWGQSFRTFDPVPSGTPPIASPNLRTINIGNSFVRRTQVAFNYSSDQTWFRRRDSSGWQTWREYIHSGNISVQTVANATNATNATSATTSRYLYGAGSSSIQCTSGGTSYQYNYQVRENLGGSGNTSETYAPQLAFHWGSVVASSIMCEASGRIAIRNNPGTSYEAFAASNITATGAMYSPIYYDTNTAYYGDFASTSNLNALQFNYTQHGSANNIRMGNSTTMNAISSGTNNAAFGVEALGGCSTGSRNFAYGYASLFSLSSGGSNIAMGDATGYNVTSGSNNLLFGQNAGRTGYQSPQSIAGVTSGSNQIHMGNESHSTARIQISWTVNSDSRDKTDVTPIDVGLDFVKDLNPVTFRWDKRSDYEDRIPTGKNKLEELTLGFLAQEVEEVEKSYGYDVANKTNLVVDRDVDQDHFGITYEKMIPILTKAIQELETRVKELENK
mgnify:FL=1